MLEILATSPVGWLAAPVLLVVLALLFALAVIYFRSCYSYWSQRGVGSPDPVWGIGNLYARLRPTMSMAEFDQWLYQDCGGSRFCGFYEFLQPVLMVGEPELLKHIMIRDFDHFCDRSFVTFNEPVMDHMLLGLKGSVWKRVRSVMTPTFSSGKVKQTLGLVNDCAANLVKYFNKQLDQGRSVYEMKDVYGTFTMDAIASIAFGVSSDSLNNTQDEFSAAAARFFAPPPTWKRPILFLQFCLPQIARRLGVNKLDRTPIHFFSKVVSDTMKYRLEHKLRRNDFLQLLLDASLQEKTNNNRLTNRNRCAVRDSARTDKTQTTSTETPGVKSSYEDTTAPNIRNRHFPGVCENTTTTATDNHSTRVNGFSNGESSGLRRNPGVATRDGCVEEPAKNGTTVRDTSEYLHSTAPSHDKNADVQEPVLTEEVITAQCVLFYMAGYDTTATTLSFVSYCLALHPAVQQRLMTEVEDTLAMHGNQVTYEAIQEMVYLDMVFAETLRLFPPAPRVDRRCTKSYTLPGTRVNIEAGTKVTIPIYSIQRDSRYYPDPERFNPERFSSENKNSRSQVVYMPFGSGPRNCIGKRFALMEAKIALVQLLQEFAFLPCKKTQVPMQLEKTSGLLKAQDGVWLRLAKRVAD